MALALKPHPLGGALAGSLGLERADPADPARRGRMVVAAVMVRRAGHCGGGVAEMGERGKGEGEVGRALPTLRNGRRSAAPMAVTLQIDR